MNAFAPRHWLALSTVLVAAACATAPPPPPVLSLDSLSCSAKPDLAGTIPLAFDPKDPKDVTQTMDVHTPCFEPAAGLKSLYRVFTLPADDLADPYVISVASTPIGEGVFAPHVTLLDANGVPTREIGQDRFVFRGTSLSVLFRSHPEERYLLIASDPGMIGEKFSRLAEATQVTAVSGGYAYFELHTGSDATVNLVYAHSGSITIELSAVPQEPPKK